MKTRTTILACIMIMMSVMAFSQTCVDFESLTLGTEYGNGINTIGEIIFTENDIPVSVEYFEWVGGGGTFGTATVTNGSSGIGSGLDVFISNINFGFDFSNLGFVPNWVTFDFVDQGGEENISVNGSPIYAGDLEFAILPPGVSMVINDMGTYSQAILAGNIQSLLIGGQEFTLDNVCAQIKDDPGPCVEFEILPIGAIFGAGYNIVGEEIFTENDITVEVDSFFYVGGGGTFNNCNVIDGSATLGTGNAMWTSNINLDFDFSGIGFTPNRLTFDFIDQGGNENISVNGEPIFAGELNMAPMPPGVSMSITDMGAFQRATISGPIVSLLIGGQEFLIDNICPFIMVDPSDCVDFDLLSLGTIYGDGFNLEGEVIFTENDIDVSVEYFEWPSGGTFGNASVIDGMSTFNSGLAMQTSNINLKFDLTNLPAMSNWVSFDFYDGGGLENFSVNGFPIFVGELTEVLVPPGFTVGIIDMGTYQHFEIAGEQIITEFLVGGQEFLIDNVCAGYTIDPSDCIDFEYLASGAEFGDGHNTIGEEIFIENDVPVSVEYFEWIGGGTFGNCWVIDGNPVYNDGKAMWTSNINLKVDLSTTYPGSTSISFDFSDYGGHENIGLNGNPIYVGELSTAILPAGFSISINTTPEHSSAIITANEIITELVIGGQEFTIDNICPSYNVSIEDLGSTNNTQVEIGQNYPNPFNANTNIPFEVKKNTHVIITVYDYLGKEIAVLTDTDYLPGDYKVEWKADNASHGFYFYQLRTENGSQTRKMSLIK